MSENPKVVFLKGKKTNLRPVMRADLPRLLQWVNDPEVKHFVGNILPQSEHDEEEWLKRIDHNKATDLVFVLETSEGRPIGTMSVGRINWYDRTAMTGALIGEKDCWGMGYGSDAKMSLLNFAFNTLNLRKICSGVVAYNERSVRYSLRCGYKEEGRLRAHVFRNGEYHDMVQLAVFREDFTPIWKKYTEEL